MTTLNDLIRLARDNGLRWAEDKKTGVRVVLKRDQMGNRVECYINGVRKSERTARKVQEGAA